MLASHNRQASADKLMPNCRFLQTLIVLSLIPGTIMLVFE
jgi:hypothetical protein